MHAVYVQKSSPEEFSRAILDIISMGEESRKTKLQNAQYWASSFTWEKSASRTLEVLKEVGKVIRAA